MLVNLFIRLLQVYIQFFSIAQYLQETDRQTGFKTYSTTAKEMHIIHLQKLSDTLAEKLRKITTKIRIFVRSILEVNMFKLLKNEIN